LKAGLSRTIPPLKIGSDVDKAGYMLDVSEFRDEVNRKIHEELDHRAEEWGSLVESAEIVQRFSKATLRTSYREGGWGRRAEK
jgi:hypothetical protein